MKYLVLLQIFGAACMSFGAEPAIVVLELLPNASRFDVLFKPALQTADGQTISADCKIMTPADLQDGVSTLAADTFDRVRLSTTRPLNAGLKVEVLCASVDYFDAAGKKGAVKNLKVSGTVPAVDQLQKLYLDKFDKAKKAAKKQNEKDIFVSGFVTTASSGTSGGGDISLNPDLGIKDVKSFLQIKKTTQEGGDAKHFEAGARYSHFFLADRKAYAALEGQSAKSFAQLKSILDQNASKSPYARAFIGSTADVAFKMEGSAGKFDVTNFVGDSAFTMRTKTGGILNNHGYFRGFITPFAFEGGQSHANQSAAVAAGKPPIQPDWIARYKSGLGFRLHFADPKGQSILQRVELSGDGVFRDLFFQESMWDAKVKLVNKTGKGIRAYGQIDLKVYLGESETALYGLKLSYNRGSLPPVFARVKSFQFGFLYESKDEKK